MLVTLANGFGMCAQEGMLITPADGFGLYAQEGNAGNVSERFGLYAQDGMLVTSANGLACVLRIGCW